MLDNNCAPKLPLEPECDLIVDPTCGLPKEKIKCDEFGFCEEIPECDPRVDPLCGLSENCNPEIDPLCKLIFYSKENIDQTYCDPSDPTCLKY